MAHRYHPRLVDDVLAELLKHHPAVLLVGPRATGKTTTALRHAKTIVRLDEPGQAAVVQADPDVALRGLAEPVLVDEWQVVPEVLGAIKRSVDSDSRPGRFIVTGSVRGDIDSPTWPGTGRLLRVGMYGMTVGELHRAVSRQPLLDRLDSDGVEALLGLPHETHDLSGYVDLAATGGFPQPAVRLPPEERSAWYDSYIDQLISRDVAELNTRRDPQLMRRYLESCAVHTAGVVDHRSIYEAAGLAKATGEAYDSLLTNLLVIEAVPAWWSNRIKRLTRGPKRYVVDPAMVLSLLRLNVRGVMRDGDVLGRTIDTFVMAQLRAQISACHSRPRLFHLRQEKGQHEVDTLVEYGAGRVAGFEIKSTSAPTAGDARHLRWLRDEMGDRFVGGVVLHTGPRAFMLDERVVAAPISTLWA